MDSPTPDGKPAPPAAVKGLTRAEQIGKAADWILAGLRTSQLAEEWARAGWGELTPPEVLRVAAAAHEIIRADAQIQPELEQAKALGRLNDLFARALEIQDHKTCLRIQTQLTALVTRIETARQLAQGT